MYILLQILLILRLGRSSQILVALTLKEAALVVHSGRTRVVVVDWWQANTLSCVKLNHLGVLTLPRLRSCIEKLLGLLMMRPALLNDNLVVRCCPDMSHRHCWRISDRLMVAIEWLPRSHIKLLILNLICVLPIIQIVCDHVSFLHFYFRNL